MPATLLDPQLPDVGDVRRAALRIAGQVRRTPVLQEPDLDKSAGCHLFFKCENLQRTGAFKFRGASHAIARLGERGHRGDVATHSSGNHGAALALAARLDGRVAHVVMPANASKLKIEAVQRHGGIVHFCEPTQAAREAGLAELVAAGHEPIPPYDDADIIAGQGTACLELLEQVPGLDLVVAPVGGGGLVSGTALVAHAAGVITLGAEPEAAADTAAGLAAGHRITDWQPDTIADGLRAIVGVRNFAIIQDKVEAVITVTEDGIRTAMSLFWTHTRLLLEPSAAVAVAAAIAHPARLVGRRAGIILSGGNIDPEEWLRLARPRGRAPG